MKQNALNKVLKMFAAFMAMTLFMDAASALPEEQARDSSSAGYFAHKAEIDSCRTDENANVQFLNGVTCLNSLITTEVVETLLSARPFKTVVVDTDGGSASAAMDLGQAIFDDKAVVIIDGSCYSSCANYLIPAAAFRLSVLDGSIIGIHGSPPRDHHRVVGDYLTSKGLTLSDVAKHPHLFQEAAQTYPDHIDQHIIPEVRYFARILVQEAYVTRFFELQRSINERKILGCQPERGTMLIVGPKYLQMFRIGTDYMWWPEDRSEIIDVFPSKIDYALIFDTDEYIGWSDTGGFRSAVECLPN